MSQHAASGFLEFVNAAPSPFHAAAEAARRLTAAGYTELRERDVWTLRPGAKHFVVRNQSAVLAFAVGGKYVAGNGFTIAAAHTDSPCLRVKPVSSLTKSGYLSVGVETYGAANMQLRDSQSRAEQQCTRWLRRLRVPSRPPDARRNAGGLWYSWLDRDLSVAGRAVVRTADGAFDSRLVRVERPILRIPSLAIHLNRDVNSDGLKLNAENHLAPILCSAVKARLDGSTEAAAPVTAAAASPAGAAPAASRHHAPLVKLLAEALAVASPADVLDFDLCLYDTQPAAVGGLFEEFIYSARLDNLMMTYVLVSALIESTAAGAGAAAALPGAAALSVPLEEDPNCRIIAAFDHEEVGSASVPGAGSTLLEDALRRLCPDPALLAPALRKSVLVSADMAHAVHPNFPSLHEENHRPAMHGGVVLKCNSNQRYATTSVTAFLFRQLAAEAGVPVQSFVNRQDMGCGSTIGPICATRLGIRTVDVGLPQLSMHSIREMCGTDDVGHGLSFFTYLFGRFASLDAATAHAS